MKLKERLLIPDQGYSEICVRSSESIAIKRHLQTALSMSQKEVDH